MEPSPSLDATIVLRTAQGESHFGARVVLDPGSGAMRSDHADAPSIVDAPPAATLRSVSGGWLFDAAPEGRIRINGVPVAGARIVIAGDVITIGGTQLLVEEAQPRGLALRRFELEGNETLPPVGDSVRTLAAPAEEFTVELSQVPSVEGIGPMQVRAKPRSKLNYLAWAMGLLLAVVLGLFALLKPIALDLRPGDAEVSSVGSFSWQSASSVFVFPGEHTLRAEREARNGHRAAVLWLTGLPGSGKSTIGQIVERELFSAGTQTMLLDGDNVRHGLSGDLGFSERDRMENIRRVASRPRELRLRGGVQKNRP